MADTFNFKKFLFENKLGAYSKAEQLNEELYDFIEDFTRLHGRKPTKAEIEAQYGYGTTRSEPSSKYSGYRKPTTDQVVDTIANKIQTSKSSSRDIEKYKYKKNERAQAKQALENAIAKIVDADTTIPQEKKEQLKSDVLKKILDPIKKQWASYAQQKAAQSTTPSTGTGNELQDASIAEELSTESYGGVNPEGDRLVMDFLKKVASDFDYSVEDAAFFVKKTIDSLFKF